MPPINHHVTGLEYWRSLEQLAETPEVAEFLDKEFPGYDADTIAATSRRGFMKLMGAAMALAGVTLTGCRRWPKEQLAPYSSAPRGVTPGVAERYATSYELNGVGTGLLVTSYDGRPIKIEGSPDHPSSYTVKGHYGSADAFAQATLLEMYDPMRRPPDVQAPLIDRREGPTSHRPATWETFAKAKPPIGDGFAILSEATSSLSVLAQRKALLKAFPDVKWFEYEPLSRDNEREGAMLAFRKPLRTVLRLDKADVVVCLDADLLGTHPNHTRYANDWSQKRRSADTDKTMSRVHVAESTFSLTGSVADARLGVAPGRIYALVRAIAGRLGSIGIPVFEEWDEKHWSGEILPQIVPPPPPPAPISAPPLSPAEAKFVEAAVNDLKEAKGNGVVAVGPTAPPEAHAVAHAINVALGALGTTVNYILETGQPNRPTHFAAISKLTNAIKNGAISTLVILGGNPVYDAPADLNFAAALASLPNSVHLSLFDDETSRLCKWHLPRAHYLESWGDSRSWDGTITLQQPLILPLYGGKSVIEVLGMYIPDGKTAGDQIVRKTMGEPADDAGRNAFDLTFRRNLERGFVEGSEGKPVADLKANLTNLPAVEPAPAGFTLRFDADSHTYDGRFANNGWLQETPDPLTKLMWDNALILSVKDARHLDVDMGDLVEVTVPGAVKPMVLPVYLLPGQPGGVASLSLGYGRTAAGPVGEGLGFNSYALRTSGAPWAVPNVQIKPVTGSYQLVSSAEHHIFSPTARAAEEYRLGQKNETGKIVHDITLEEYKQNPKDAGGTVRRVGLQLFAPTVNNDFHDLHAWGMAVDLTACIGCNACAVACQAENNIPIVGKAQCNKHREMNWIRIDRYFKGEAEDPEPEVVYEPMMCQHCENAPCEQVCPVAATVHDSEGLNTMVYNRCIGTRYCANNCPYKVRRFNYFDYHAQDPRFGNEWVKVPWLDMPDTQQRDEKLIDPVKRMAFNPEVTVRMRGVMEKCTFCVQRIHPTVTAKRAQGKDIVDGDIITACQQACPTQAIVFGNLMDENSLVSKLQKSARAFDVLQEDLNTKPRTRYLAKVRNPAEHA